MPFCSTLCLSEAVIAFYVLIQIGQVETQVLIGSLLSATLLVDILEHAQASTLTAKAVGAGAIRLHISIVVIAFFLLTHTASRFRISVEKALQKSSIMMLLLLFLVVLVVIVSTHGTGRTVEPIDCILSYGILMTRFLLDNINS